MVLFKHTMAQHICRERGDINYSILLDCMKRFHCVTCQVTLNKIRRKEGILSDILITTLVSLHFTGIQILRPLDILCSGASTPP